IFELLVYTGNDFWGHWFILGGFLGEADPLRSGFVADVQSRFEASLVILGEGEELSLSAKGLTSVPLLERLTRVTRLDLSGNGLRDLPGALGALRRLRVRKPVQTMTELGVAPPLPRLSRLRLDRNRTDW
ncbi:hypothetical protein HGM15179_021160, partial [Zosterops borbonicus]